MGDIMEGVGWWLREQQHGLWERSIQAEDTTVIGWLLNSLREMDLSALQEALFAMDPQLEVGLRWRLISLGRSGPIPEEQRVRAVHIEVDKTKVEAIKPILYRIYGHDSVGPFPSGIKMRLVPEITPLMGLASRAKADKLRNRQANFVQYCMKAVSWEIATLDYVDTTIGHSLRQMIMTVRARNQPNLSLFHSIDAQWQGNGHVVTFVPEFESEARTVLAGLIPFLHYLFPEHVERVNAMFTPAAVERSQEASWDPESYAVLTPDNGILANLEEVDAELNIQPPSSAAATGGLSIANNLSPPARPNPNRLITRTLYGNDNDSVSTIDTQGTRRRGRSASRNSSRSQPIARSRSPSVTTQQSTISSVTVEERMVTMEAQMTRVMSTFEQLLTHFDSRNPNDTTNRLDEPSSSSQDHLDGHPVVTPGLSAGGLPPGAAGTRQ